MSVTTEERAREWTAKNSSDPMSYSLVSLIRLLNCVHAEGASEEHAREAKRYARLVRRVIQASGADDRVGGLTAVQAVRLGREKARAEGRAEGLREAARVCDEILGVAAPGGQATTARLCRSQILVLVPEGA